MTAGPMVRRMDRCWYPEYESNWDDDAFRARILARMTGEMIVLDLGAGAGIVRQMDFRQHAASVCGVDPDPRVIGNQYLNEARIGSAEAIPWQDEAFDLVYCDNVLEHLADPERVFREIARVLKPGGWFLAKTPNKWHYMPLLARLTPHGFHRYYNRLRGRAESDTFPTRYRANSRRAICRLAAASGLSVERLTFIEGRPEYLRISPISYVAGAAYERLVNSTDLLAGLRIVLISELRRPAGAVAVGESRA